MREAHSISFPIWRIDDSSDPTSHGSVSLGRSNRTGYTIRVAAASRDPSFVTDRIVVPLFPLASTLPTILNPSILQFPCQYHILILDSGTFETTADLIVWSATFPPVLHQENNGHKQSKNIFGSAYT